MLCLHHNSQSFTKIICGKVLFSTLGFWISLQYTRTQLLCLLFFQGADSIKRCHLTSIGNPIVEIRRSYDRLISTMGFPILVRWHLYIESGPRYLHMKQSFITLSAHWRATMDLHELGMYCSHSSFVSECKKLWQVVLFILILFTLLRLYHIEYLIKIYRAGPRLGLPYMRQALLMLAACSKSYSYSDGYCQLYIVHV